jgi:MFS family permease
VLAVVVAFVAGAATMVIEIAAARVLAPALGVSLYSWTAIIGTVLAGLAGGGWLGGWLADRVGGGRVLLGGAMVAAYGALLLPAASGVAPSVRFGAWDDVVARTLFVAAATVLAPSLGLGAILPAAVRARGASGRVVGTLYAAATAGGILGVFATGLVLIDVLGSRRTIVLAGAAVLLAALAGWARAGRPRAAALLLVPFASALASPAWLDGPCTTESAYFCIQVIDSAEPGGTRALKLDRLVHGAISVDDPTAIGRGYARLMADVSDAFAPADGAQRALFVGGGAYVVPRYLTARYPTAEVDVVEIDPRVTGTAEGRLGLVHSARLRSHNLDARQFLLGGGPDRYDVVYGDAFNDLSIPHHLTTREFAAMVRSVLRPAGLYIVNVIDLFHDGRLLRSFVLTLREEFASVDVVLDIGERDAIQLERARRAPGDAEHRRAAVVVASQRRPDFDRLAALPRGTGVALPRDELDAYLAAGRGVVLTDDYAPVDALTAPIFLGRPI